MASKKDRLSRQIRDEVEKNMGDSGMSGFVDDVASRRNDSEENQEVKSSYQKEKPMKQGSGAGDFRVSQDKRDSVYNISGDIRLEDYTESKKNNRFWQKEGFFRYVGFGFLSIVAIVVIWSFFGWLFGPKYKLAISTVELTEANINDFLDTKSVVLAAGQPIHIRFQWSEGDLDTDYLKILIQKKGESDFEEEAVLGRRPPQTATYIYFYGPLDHGDYKITVFDRKGSTLKERDLKIR
ncbi:MAG: hypothetical protein H3C43_07735 [Leptonema sp. (in: Bacteria)]|nr:hypothetical protein [Leptonema sp. (in: bacteria)]